MRKKRLNISGFSFPLPRAAEDVSNSLCLLGKDPCFSQRGYYESEYKRLGTI